MELQHIWSHQQTDLWYLHWTSAKPCVCLSWALHWPFFLCVLRADVKVIVSRGRAADTTERTRVIFSRAFSFWLSSVLKSHNGVVLMLLQQLQYFNYNWSRSKHESREIFYVKNKKQPVEIHLPAAQVQVTISQRLQAVSTKSFTPNHKSKCRLN